MAIRLYFITGILGSGKTTLIKHILGGITGEKIGLIINEFGQMGVDGEVIEASGIEMRQLNDGQVFCSCLSHKFVDTLYAYTKLPITLLIVETSGLANPVSLTKVLKDLKKIAGDCYEYCGMIDLIDPTTFGILRQALMAVDEQVVKSDYIILNKVDLLKPGEKEDIINELRLLNATAPIEEVEYGKVSPSLFKENLLIPEKVCLSRTVVDNDRPKHFLLTAPGKVSKEAVTRFLTALAPESFRIKGFVDTEEGLLHADVVASDVQLRPFDGKRDGTSIVIISAIGGSLMDKIRSSWDSYVAVPAEIVENVFVYNPPPEDS